MRSFHIPTLTTSTITTPALQTKILQRSDSLLKVQAGIPDLVLLIPVLNPILFDQIFSSQFIVSTFIHDIDHVTDIMSSLNRYSMPVTKSRNGIQDMLSLDQTNTTRFLFGDDESATSTDSKNYLQMHATDDNFPILVRGEHPQKVTFRFLQYWPII